MSSTCWTEFIDLLCQYNNPKDVVFDSKEYFVGT